MTKSKSSTIAIVVLSVLLAAALASTIVLAAFSQTRTATTTITFASGIQISVTGISGSDPYYWDATVGSTSNKTGTINATGSEDVVLDAVSATVTTGTAYIAILPTVSYLPTATSEESARVSVDVTSTFNTTNLQAMTDTEYTSWYITKVAKTSTDGATALLSAYTLYDESEDTTGAAASRVYTCNVKIVAATDLVGIKAAIDALNA